MNADSLKNNKRKILKQTGRQYISRNGKQALLPKKYFFFAMTGHVIYRIKI